MAMPGRGGILTCHIENIDMLYASYLSFVTNGALFVPSDRAQKLGDEVFIAVTLPNSSERLPMNGKVVWINSKAQSGRPVFRRFPAGQRHRGHRKNAWRHP